jgi:FkbM family methyltransferase
MSEGAPRVRFRAGSRGLSRWLYYASSFPAVLLRMRRRGDILRLLLGLPVRRPLEIRLDSGARFGVSKRMDVWIIKESCLDRVYDRGTDFEDGWTIVDIGAGLGDFAIHAALRRPRATVYALEPLPESFAQLEENIRLNALTNVRAVREAIAGSEGAVSLHTVTGLSGQHRTAGSGAMRTIVAPISVAATTLSGAFERFGIARCDFLKIDCEGAEYEILLGLSGETLARIARIALEYHDNMTAHTHDELVRFLQARGFTVRTRPSPAWHELGFLYAVNPGLVASQRTT